MSFSLEVGAYVTLDELSGICIPKFIVVRRLGFAMLLFSRLWR